MSLTTATADLPLYLQMSRYTKGSKAVMELRTQRFLAEQTAATTTNTGTTNAGASNQPDDNIITGSINNSDDAKPHDHFSFDDFLDTINPLQHLPVISTLYREMTGDQITPTARVVGGAIYGGPIGAGLALADSVFEQASGSTAGAHVMAWLNGDDTTSQQQVARNTPVGTQDNSPPAVSTPRNERNFNSAPAPTLTVNPITASITGLPQLSPEAFSALLTSTPEGTNIAQPNRNPAERTPGPVDISLAMSAALDRYQSASQTDRP